MSTSQAEWKVAMLQEREDRIAELTRKIERLRAELGDKIRHFNIVDAMWRHAEEEVERLRAVLNDLLSNPDGSHAFERAKNEARQALEEKE
jgi:uncharacterized small protein (DUF1192 family)